MTSPPFPFDSTTLRPLLVLNLELALSLLLLWDNSPHHCKPCAHVHGSLLARSCHGPAHYGSVVGTSSPSSRRNTRVNTVATTLATPRCTPEYCCGGEFKLPSIPYLSANIRCSNCPRYISWRLRYRHRSPWCTCS